MGQKYSIDFEDDVYQDFLIFIVDILVKKEKEKKEVNIQKFKIKDKVK